MEGRFATGKAWILDRGSGSGRGSGRTLEEAFDLESERLKAFIEDSPVPEVFSAHLEMLEDQLLRDTILRNVSGGMVPVDAVIAAEDEIMGLFLGIDDEYLRSRVDDVRDVCQGLIDCLEGASPNSYESLPPDAVVVAEELFPSDTAMMDLDKVKAFVTAKGSPTSHVRVIARSRGIPAVTGADISGIRSGDLLLVDEANGTVEVNPTEERLEAVRSMNRGVSVFPEEARRAVLDSGVKVLGNAGSIKEIEAVIGAGAEGIGLFRTEFLFLGSDNLPSEEEQYQIYKKAVEACQGRPLTIRTMDIGGDKTVPCLNLPKEDNPFLGMRGIRLSLSMPELFKEQIRAILRASALGKVRIMLPMVSRVSEVIQAKALVKECEASLEASGTGFGKNIEIGVMIETPAAAFVADLLACETDFFSVGTNDLTQYVMAADRGNASVSYLLDPLDDAMIQALRIVFKAAREKGVPVSVCGEAASEPKVAPVLCEMGADSLSLGSPALIGELKGSD